MLVGVPAGKNPNVPLSATLIKFSFDILTHSSKIVSIGIFLIGPSKKFWFEIFSPVTVTNKVFGVKESKLVAPGCGLIAASIGGSFPSGTGPIVANSKFAGDKTAPWVPYASTILYSPFGTFWNEYSPFAFVKTAILSFVSIFFYHFFISWITEVRKITP